MLARYSIVRGAPASSLPRGIRQDTRKHTRHVLRPSEALVREVFAGAKGSPEAQQAAWARYAAAYRALLEQRFAEDPAAFDRIATFARWHDVYLGCSCPSSKNPDVQRCHTVVALAFMKERYPDLDVRFPT